MLKDSALPQSAKDSGSKVLREEQTVSKPLQKALENPLLSGWIQNLAVSVQNTGCKIKRIHPAVRIPGPRRVVHGNQWHRITKWATFFHLFGDPELARGRVHFVMCHAPLGLWIPLLQCWTGPKAYRMLISEEMLSGLQETDILFSNPFLLVKTAFVNDFCLKVNVCTDNVNLKKIKSTKKKKSYFVYGKKLYRYF